jgi:hypothetical protein
MSLRYLFPDLATAASVYLIGEHAATTGVFESPIVQAAVPWAAETLLFMAGVALQTSVENKRSGIEDPIKTAVVDTVKDLSGPDTLEVGVRYAIQLGAIALFGQSGEAALGASRASDVLYDGMVYATSTKLPRKLLQGTLLKTVVASIVSDTLRRDSVPNEQSESSSTTAAGPRDLTELVETTEELLSAILDVQEQAYVDMAAHPIRAAVGTATRLRNLAWYYTGAIPKNMLLDHELPPWDEHHTANPNTSNIRPGAAEAQRQTPRLFRRDRTQSLVSHIANWADLQRDAALRASWPLAANRRGVRRVDPNISATHKTNYNPEEVIRDARATAAHYAAIDTTLRNTLIYGDFLAAVRASSAVLMTENKSAARAIAAVADRHPFLLDPRLRFGEMLDKQLTRGEWNELLPNTEPHQAKPFFAKSGRPKTPSFVVGIG